MVSEDSETPVAQEELPPGTEDLSDPAKVKFQIRQKETHFQKQCLQGLAGASPWKESFVRVWRGVFMSAAKPLNTGGITLASSQGL